MYYRIIFVILTLFSVTYSFKTDKPCREIAPVNDFNLTAFASGVWHEIARYPNELETTHCCSYLSEIKGDKVFAYLAGVAKVPKDSPNYLEFEYEVAQDQKGLLFHTVTLGQRSFEFREYIIAVDYDKYYISYECNFDEKTKIGREYAWIVTRSQNLDEKTKSTIDNILKSSDLIDPDKLMWLDLSDCVYEEDNKLIL